MEDKNNKIEKIQIDGKKISIGLDWDVLKGTMSQQKEISILLKQQGNLDVKKGIIIKSSEEVSSVGVGFIHGKENLYGKSGAAWLSDAYKQNIVKNKKNKPNISKEEDGENEVNEAPAWLVIEKLVDMDDKYWVTIIKDGLPLPGTDVVESYYNVIERIQDFFNVIKDVEVYTKDSMILEEVNNASTMLVGECTVINKSFSEIVEKVKCRKSATILKGFDSKLLLLGTVIVAGVVGYYFWSSAQEEEAQRAAQQQQAESKRSKDASNLKMQKEYEDSKAKVVEQTIKKAKSDLNGVLSTQTAPDVINSWANLLNQIKMSHSGWDMDGVTCNVDSGIPQCLISLNRGDLGINRNLIQDFPTAIINGDKAFYILKSSPLVAQTGDYTNLPDTQEFTINILSDLELLKFGEIKHAIDASQEVTQSINLPAPPTGITQDMNVSPIKMGVSYGNMHLEGTDMWQLKGIAPKLNSTGLSVQKLSVTIDKDFKNTSWKIEGVYYVKTGKVVIPEIPPSKITGVN